MRGRCGTGFKRSVWIVVVSESRPVFEYDNQLSKLSLVVPFVLRKEIGTRRLVERNFAHIEVPDMNFQSRFKHLDLNKKTMVNPRSHELGEPKAKDSAVHEIAGGSPPLLSPPLQPCPSHSHHEDPK